MGSPSTFHRVQRGRNYSETSFSAGDCGFAVGRCDLGRLRRTDGGKHLGCTRGGPVPIAFRDCSGKTDPSKGSWNLKT